MKLPTRMHDYPEWRTIKGQSFNVAAPSGRIWHAARAMKEIEKISHMRIHMPAYRKFDSGQGLCLACCGGASRAYIEGWTTKELFEKNDDSVVEANKYEYSLDSFRSGSCADGFEHMGLSFNSGKHFDCDIWDYHSDAEAFYTQFNALGKRLFEAGY